MTPPADAAPGPLRAGDGGGPKVFVLEVTPAQPGGVRDATDAIESGHRLDDAAPPGPGPRWARRRRVRRAASTDVRRVSSGAADVDPPSIEANEKEREPEFDAAAGAEPFATGWRRRMRDKAESKAAARRGVPAWMTSVGLHVCMVVALGAITLQVVQPMRELELTAAPPLEELEESPLAEELTPVEIEGHSAELGELVDEPVLDAGIETESGIFAESPLEQLGAGADTGSGDMRAGRSAGGGLFGVGGLLGGDGLGTAEFGNGLGERPLDPIPEFFGTKIKGKRIVFILDNSGSMQDGRLETVISELLQCVESLERDQQFYVIFHSDTVYPLFYPQPIDRYISPTKAGKQALAEWLDTVELCMGDSVDEALAIAAMIEPDTVLLLSDGQIPNLKTLSFLLNGELRNFPVHTFAVGMGGSIAGRRNLQEIAAANGGEFRETETPEAMKELARRRPRMYHDRLPGLVWGRNVRARR
jgi:hypothetical protein